MKQFAKVCLLVALVLLVTGIVALAQSDAARVVGTVSDPSGAAIPGATISVVNLGTNQKITAQSQADGNFVVTALQPGNYRVEAKKEAFKTESAKITLDIAQVQRLNFKLQLGSTAETVNVTDEVPLVETTTSSAGEVIQGRQVVELPINGRNYTQLATLTPGVTRGAYSDEATGSSSQSETWRYSDTGGAALSVNGLRPQATSYLMDGINNQEGLVNTIVIFPVLESIAEFKMTTSLAPAEYGGPSAIQVGTKPGTNQVHLIADWNRRGGGVATPWGDSTPPPFARNQFGAILSGPIWKNKLFGSVDYQGWRIKQPISDGPTHVPTSLMQSGNFTELLAPGTGVATSLPYSGLPGCTAAMGTDPAAFTPGMGYIFNPANCLPFGWDAVNHVPGTQINIIPSASQNSVGIKYLNAFPAPNLTGYHPYNLDNNFQPHREQHQNNDDYDYRLDYVATPKDTFFARYSMGQDLLQTTDRLVDSGHDLPSGFGSGTNPQHPRQLAVGYTRIINNNLVNEFRYGYNRPYYGYEQPGFGTAQAASLGIPNANTSPLLGGMALIGGWKGELEYVGDYGPYVVVQKINQFADSMSLTHKSHTFKFGVSVQHKDVNFTQANVAKGYFWIDDNNEPQYSGLPGAYTGFGTFTGNEISELVGGFMGAYQIGVFNGYYKTRNWETSLFAQDDFRVNRKLTINYGIRYDVFTWPFEANNRQSNFDPLTGTLIEAGTPGYSRALVNTPMNNFAPRLGFAYDVKGDGKMVVRGGYGIFYYQERGGVGTQLSNNPDYNGSQTYSACPNFPDCSTGYRTTLSGMAPYGSSNPNSSVANGALPVGEVTFNPTNLSGANVIYYPQNSPVSNVQQWNVQVEHAIAKNTSVNLAYVGAFMSHLATSFNANGTELGTGTKWFPNIAAINEYGMVGSGKYNGLQARLNRKMSHGLQYTVAYTWSHTLDNVGGALSNGSNNIYVGPGGAPLLKYSYGNSNTDQRHALVGSMLYELPFGKHRQFLNDLPTALDYVIGGWQWNNIVTLTRGVPFNVTYNGFLADYTGGCSVGRHGDVWFSCPAGALTAAPSGTVGNLARNYFYGPGTRTWDTTLSKSFMVYKVKTEFRANVYNLLNSPQFQNPNGEATSGSGNFGILNAVRTATQRQLELTLRVSF